MYPELRWLVALAFLTSAAAWAAPATASEEAARRYFKNGVDLITGAQPNYQDGYYQFQLAYRESGQSWKVLGNLGLCALKLERDQEAAQYYEAYLRLGGDDIASEERNAIEQDLLLLKGNWATVRVSSSLPDLKLIDQREGSLAPAQPYVLKSGPMELQLRAGNHRITAVYGERRSTWEVVLEPKSSASHFFDFSPAKTSPAAVAHEPKSRSATAPGDSLRLVGWGAVSLGAVGLGLGGYFAWQSTDYEKQLDAAFACNNKAGGCSSDQRATVRGLEDDRDRAKTQSVVALAAGGAMVAMGVTLIILRSRDGSRSTEARLVPWVSHGSAGVWGRF